VAPLPGGAELLFGCQVTTWISPPTLPNSPEPASRIVVDVRAGKRFSGVRQPFETSERPPRELHSARYNVPGDNGRAVGSAHHRSARGSPERPGGGVVSDEPIGKAGEPGDMLLATLLDLLPDYF
jgi:hypothetical protein